MPYAEIFNPQARATLNTGIVSRYLSPDFWHKLFMIPKDTNITQTQALSIYATAVAGINNNADASRWYPLQNFTGMEDKSTKATINTTPVGTSIFVRDGKYHVELEYYKGGLQYHNKLRRLFHNQQDAFDVLIGDKTANGLLGTKPNLNTSGYVTKGLTLDQIYVEQYSLNNATDPAKFYLGLVFTDIEEMNERMSWLQFPDGYSVMSLFGLKDLEFQTFPSPYQAITSLVAKVKITTGGGAIDLMDAGSTTYSAALAALSSSFSFKDPAGQTITGVTVAADATTGTMSFTFVNTGVYAALASGGIISCYSPTISQMTATIPGFANGYFELTKP